MSVAALGLWLGLWLGFGHGGVAAAQTERRALDGAEAAAFAAVGRLNIAGARFCTATLIEARLVLTAAHCLFHPRTGAPVPLGELRFSPGPRPVRVGGLRVIGAAVAPGFALVKAPGAEDLRTDVALLALDEAVAPAEAEPFAVGPILGSILGAPAPLRVVSYARDRPRRLSINAACPTLGMVAEVLALACPVERGVSGAPVLAGTGAETRVVAVVSATARLPGAEPFTLTVAAAPWIGALRDLLAEAGAGQRAE